MLQRTRAVPILLLGIASGCGANRQAAPALLPAPLVTALIDDRGSHSRASPEYTVGTLPPGYPGTLVPSGPVSIVGGMAATNEIVAVFADSTRRLAAVLEQLFEQAGFTRPPASPGSGFMNAAGPSSYFCNDSAMVSADPLTGSNRHFARVTYRRGRWGFCPDSDRRSANDLHQAPAELQLPELTPPAGVRIGSAGGGQTIDGVDSRAEMTGTALVPSAILAHYATQLVAARWTAAAPAVSERVAAQFFEAKDASGAQWEGVLMAFGSTNDITVSLSMHRRTKP